MTIMFALYCAVVRLFHLYPPAARNRLTISSSQSHSTLALKAWSALCIFTYIAHVTYLSVLPRFDYTYNIIFNVILGITHNLLWSAYSLPSNFSIIQRFPSRSKTYRPAFAYKAAVFVALTTSAMCLELFDFPPWGRVVDAHALWHLATAPIASFWYNFLIQDSLDDGWREHRA